MAGCKSAPVNKYVSNQAFFFSLFLTPLQNFGSSSDCFTVFPLHLHIYFSEHWANLETDSWSLVQIIW